MSSSDNPIPAVLSTPPTAPKSVAPEAPVMDHEYDGIREYDNPLPRWWVWMWAGSFFFSVGYFFHYHVSHNGTSVESDYDADMAEAREAEAKQSLAEPVNEESLGKLAQNPALMVDAKALFGLRCAPCHGANAQGLIGPNLTDNAWLHGTGKLTDIYGVVDGGVAAKGMPAWGRQLSPIELRKVVAFIGTLRGTNVPGKAPEGAAVP